MTRVKKEAPKLGFSEFSPSRAAGDAASLPGAGDDADEMERLLARKVRAKGGKLGFA